MIAWGFAVMRQIGPRFQPGYGHASQIGKETVGRRPELGIDRKIMVSGDDRIVSRTPKALSDQHSHG
jgi:hypothetical protein